MAAAGKVQFSHNSHCNKNSRRRLICNGQTAPFFGKISPIMKKNVFLFSFFLVFATCASALEWFDAGIGGYEEWPTDGSDHIVVGTGTWLGTYGGSLGTTDYQSPDADNRLCGH